MDTLIAELVDVKEELIREMPEMLLRLDSSANSITGKPGHPLTLRGDGTIVDEGLEILLVLALKHHFKLLPASAAVISLLCIDVKGPQVIYNPGVEELPVLQLMGELKLNVGTSQWVLGQDVMLLEEEILEKQGETNLSVWGLVRI